MKPTKITLRLIVCSSILLAVTGHGQIFKADNNDDLSSGTSWVGGTAPGSGDVATWDANVATATNCTNTLSANVVWGGICVSNPVAPVNILASSSGISLGGSGIIVTNGVDLTVAPPLTTTADQTWVIGSGRMLTLGSAGQDITISSGNNVTINGVVQFPYDINISGMLAIPSGSSLISTIANAHQSINLGTASGSGVVNQTGGTVVVGYNGGTAGSPKPSMIIAFGGAYNISGGSLTDDTPGNGGRFDIGASSSAGTLNIDGTGVVQSEALYVANGGNGTINVTNGTLTIPSGVNCRIGLSSGTGTMNIYGGLVQSASAMNLPSGGGTGILNVNGGAAGLYSLNVGNSGPGTVTVNGGMLLVTNSIDLAHSSGAGTLTLNGGVTVCSSITYTHTGPSTLNFNGGMLKAGGSSASFVAGGITANVQSGGALVDTTNFNVTILCPLVDGGGSGGLTKLGSGTLTLGAAGNYTGNTMVDCGTLALSTTNHAGGAIYVTNNAGLQVTLANATTMNCSSLALAGC